MAQNLVHLRTAADCASYSNCFTDMTSLSTWLWETRWPTFTDPVTVIVGVGNFTGRLFCNSVGFPGEGGFVTFKGESRTGSRLVGTDTSYPFATVRSYQCDELDFQNLTIVAPNHQTGIALYWTDVGDSRWIDVDIQANYATWYDSGCGGVPSTSPPVGLHYFQNSTLVAGTLGWYADCGEAVLYDTQISVVPSNSTNVPGQTPTVTGLIANYRAEFYLLDSVVTVDATQRSAATTTIGLDAGTSGNQLPQGSGEVEMFGGALIVKGNADDTLHGARARKFSETAEPAAVRIQGTQLTIQNGTAAAKVVSGDGDLERVDLEP